MDFFEYASLAGEFVNSVWVQFIVGGLCFAIVFIFEAIALFTIAVRYGYRHKWMAFVPFFNTYYIGVCAQKNRFYNIDAKKIGLVTAIFEAVLFAGYVLYYVAYFLVMKYEVAVPTEVFNGLTVYIYELRNCPQELAWAAWIYDYLNRFILRFVDLVFLIFNIALLICFFQTYACRRYVLFTITSVLFPIQGILFFIVRNNVGVNYRDFLRAEQARQYAAYQNYQQQQNFNGNPYGRDGYNNNPYNNNGYGNRDGGASGDPFGGLGGSGNGENKGGSPFDEFDN